MELTNIAIDQNIKPFLRWAGGKTWLLKYLKNIKNTKFNNYHEAFLGGAATYFYLQPNGHAYLSDLNGELIETYQTIKDSAEDVIKKLETFKNAEEDYYQIRSTIFENSVERAARFIYLNQTSYNGIYRVNLKGKYNVPFGFRTKNFLDKENILSAQKALRNTSLKHCDFYDVLNNVKSGDLVFLDPPYTVSHNLNGFIKYNEKIFSLEDQIRLSKLIDELKNIGAYYILTNAAHKTIEEIFDKGDRQFEFKRASLIGGTNSERGQTSEFVFTNADL
ncbi:DNA adenine methylase [Pedobacter sp. KBW06]|uniref:DNA adenine methylase n=1 Tax=Pedobacter sp. KBW06 TaxID=2153359 RepID=UPI000F5ACD31|nr:Dam family site-specific DNA-(adenine-N6)-methyltransferase [Pedobacter sp. KBW06]RQO65188.1 DNA adenine methylase [Pedobacter sp. KBW06]